MKKLFILLVLAFVLSCSSDNNDCKKVTSLDSIKNTDGTYTYKIQIDNGETVVTNKATVDFYRHAGAPDCFEGYK